MLKHSYYQCPVCCKSMVDMSEAWRQFDFSIEQQPMPQEFKDSKVKILCNDCQSKTEVPFHYLGNKCASCKSYNTSILEKMNMPSDSPWVAVMDQLNQMVVAPTRQNNNSSNANNDNNNRTENDKDSENN